MSEVHFLFFIFYIFRSFFCFKFCNSISWKVLKYLVSLCEVTSEDFFSVVLYYECRRFSLVIEVALLHFSRMSRIPALAYGSVLLARPALAFLLCLLRLLGCLLGFLTDSLLYSLL